MKVSNVLLWVLQVLLALWNITGALYMMGHFGSLVNAWAQVFPSFFWIILGSFQILFSLGLIIPGILRLPSKFTVISAVGLAVISLGGIFLFSAYSGFPGLLWGLLPAILEAAIAYGRLIYK